MVARPSAEQVGAQGGAGGPARRWLTGAACLLALAALATAGATGVARHVAAFWLSRGFAGPSVPRTVHVREPGGRFRQVPVVYPVVRAITVRSRALGGYADHVYVALPPGYASHPGQRYPVLYLLPGLAGDPVQFLGAGRVPATEALLVARGVMKPMILVMPAGTRSFLGDGEWASGVRLGHGWETFIARDLVRAIDARYRAIPGGSARGIAGLSEGGYAALSIGLHHPGEFRLMESWSGYMTADRMPGVSGRSVSTHAHNGPARWVYVVARQLRADRSYVWFYIGASDPLAVRNRAFDAELTALGVGHYYFETPGRHDWALWRGVLPQAFITASERLGRG